jgi:hypothetical protein
MPVHPIGTPWWRAKRKEMETKAVSLDGFRYRGMTIAELDEIIDYYRMHRGKLPNGEVEINPCAEQIKTALDEAGDCYQDPPCW